MRRKAKKLGDGLEMMWEMSLTMVGGSLGRREWTLGRPVAERMGPIFAVSGGLSLLSIGDDISYRTESTGTHQNPPSLLGRY